MASFQPTNQQREESCAIISPNRAMPTEVERKRQNEVERARREALNSGFGRLADVVPTFQSRQQQQHTPTTESATPLPASKQMILDEARLHILHLQAELDSLKRNLVESDMKCFNLVAELHRISSASGLTPELEGIQQQQQSPLTSHSASLSPLSPISSTHSESGNTGDESQTSRKRKEPHNNTIQLPPLKQSVLLPNLVRNQTILPAVQITPPSSSYQVCQQPSRASSPATVILASTQAPVANPVAVEKARPIMKSGRRKGSLNYNSAAAKRQAQQGVGQSTPQLLFRIPSASH